MLAVNRVANALGSSYSVLFISVSSQYKRMPRYRGAFRCGLKTARMCKRKRMPLERLNLSSKKLLTIFTNLKKFNHLFYIICELILKIQILAPAQ